MSFHDGHYTIIEFRCRLVLPPSQFGQPNTSRCKQFTPITERHLAANLNINGNFVLCIITSTLYRDELLGSLTGRFPQGKKASTN